MINTHKPILRNENQKHSNTVSLLSAAAVALGAAILVAAPSKAEAKKTTLTPADEKFIQNEAAEGTTLVMIATIAAKNAEREDIRAFAETLVTDHSKANADLVKIALAQGVELTTKVTPKNAKLIKSFNDLSGADLDQAFLSTVQSAHQKCVDHLEGASSATTDEDLKSWAAATLPGLRNHLVKAKELGAGTPKGGTRETDESESNTRERDARTVTPPDRDNGRSDADTTAQIRKAIQATAGMSLNARNVRIVTKDGMVTLGGPVKSTEEKRQIGEIASRIAGDKNTDNQLDVEDAARRPGRPVNLRVQ